MCFYLRYKNRVGQYKFSDSQYCFFYFIYYSFFLYISQKLISLPPPPPPTILPRVLLKQNSRYFVCFHCCCSCSEMLCIIFAQKRRVFDKHIVSTSCTGCIKFHVTRTSNEIIKLKLKKKQFKISAPRISAECLNDYR